MQSFDYVLEDFVSGLGFAEAPRWHDNALWISDIVGREVLRFDSSGNSECVIKTRGDPSGLGWLADGSLLVVQMDEHEVWRLHEGEFTRFSSTGHISRVKLNDMVAGARGDIWVSSFGYDYESELPCSTNLIHIDGHGHASIAARDLWFPNGMAINAAGNRLVVAQSASQEVLEFDITGKGKLANRRVFGTLSGTASSDGICIDQEECIWIASPATREFLRMQRGGQITHRISTGLRHAVACVLGGPGRNTLFGITATTLNLRGARSLRQSSIGTATVPVPGVGVP